MFIHTVYFWMKDDLDETEALAFEKGLDTLCNKTTAITGSFGKPADSPERDVVDHSFGYSLHLSFDTIEDHDVYQVSDVHQRFIAEHKDKWTAVKVYDTQTA